MPISSSSDYLPPAALSLAINLKMAVFARQPLSSSPIVSVARRRPFFMFGLPFISILVLGSFALSSFTQTRYDLRNSKVQTLSKEEELKMDKKRKKVDIKEEYYRLQAKDLGQLDGGGIDSWENKRVPRLPGQGEWGDMSTTKTTVVPKQSEEARLV
jgi:cytochrome c oxidase assembly protein subunit 16